MSIIQVKRQVPASAPKRGGSPGSGQLMRVRERIAGFAQDKSGDVAVIFGLMAMTMFMLIGAAVDFGRWLNARDHTIAAIDAAVLAGGRALQSPDPSLNMTAEAQAKAMAKRYYDEAVKNRLEVSDTIQFKVESSGTVVTVDGNVKIKTPFMGLAGIKELPILKQDGEEYPKAVLSVGGNAELNLEIAMMLDVSGSMGQNGKLRDMKDAAKDLVDIVIWEDQSKYKSRIALVPFSGDVRLPSTLFNAVTDPLLASSYKDSGDTVSKSTCVGERGGTGIKYTDAVPTVGQWIPAIYDGCSTNDSKSVLIPMSKNKVMLSNAIENLVKGGATGGHIGTAWAHFMLSPKWATILGPDSAPTAYHQVKTKKIAILMTDGQYNSINRNVKHKVKVGGVNVTTTITNAAIAADDDDGPGSINGVDSPTQAVSQCTRMKNTDEIEIYTIGFDMTDIPEALATLQACATDESHFYNASNGEQLRKAFRDIALKISTLHLKQ